MLKWLCFKVWIVHELDCITSKRGFINSRSLHKIVLLLFFFFFFFIYWHYNPLWVLAFSVILFHSAISLHWFLRLIPIICISSSVPAFHLFLGLPIILVSIGFHSNILLGWVHTCNVTTYRNTVSWQCRRDSCPRNVSKVGYAVTLRACSVCCRYLAVASKGRYRYGRSRCGRAASRCTSTSARRNGRVHLNRQGAVSSVNYWQPRCAHQRS